MPDDDSLGRAEKEPIELIFLKARIYARIVRPLRYILQYYVLVYGLFVYCGKCIFVQAHSQKFYHLPQKQGIALGGTYNSSILL